MCSILGIFGIQSPTEAQRLRQLGVELSKRQRHRGPDWSGVYHGERAILVHERLAIVDPVSGSQPLVDVDDQLFLAVNGEIYNHRELERGLAEPYPFRTGSDCEVLLPLYRGRGVEFLNDVNGIFAFALFDEHDGSYLIARDPIGVIPLYTGRDEHGYLWVASEMKALVDVCPHVEEFPPGHYLTTGDAAPVRYYQPTWREFDRVKETPLDAVELGDALEAAVVRQLMCDVPYGVLLSGGLDSSLVSALAQRHSQRRVENDEKTGAWWPQLHSFAVGLEGSPDLAAAQTVADHIGTVHHGIVYTVQDGLDALPDVVRHLETYDVTTIRAATPMYLMARRIKAMGIKMVLSGEGADEIFGGYLYFHKAPDARAFHEETVRKLDALHQFDCLRANKAMAAWGVEARVPFLDRAFLDVAMSFDPAAKMVGGNDRKIEKYALRKAFEGLIPDSVLWRQKEQFSDGVGYSWIDSLRDHAEREVTDAQLENAAFRFSVNPPTTKEAYYYRDLFEAVFPGEAAARCVPGGPSIACSTPVAIEWDASFKKNADPSGRAVLGVHDSASDA